MGRFSSELRGGSFWAVALAAAVAYGTFQLALNLVGYVIYPLVHELIDVDLSVIPIRLSTSNAFGANPSLTNILLGPSLRVLLAGLLTVMALAQAYRWSLQAALEDSSECPFCLSAIPVEATRCAYCGADQPEPEEDEPALPPQIDAP